MKKFLLMVLLILVAGLLALGYTFMPQNLPVPEAAQVEVPAVQPPEGMKISAIYAGKMLSQAMFAYRGGKPGEAREFGMGGILVQHPRGTLLFDTGFGSDVDEHFKTIPALMQATSKYVKETPVAAQLRKAGIEPADLTGVILTHAHWDHVSGIPDLKGAPIWVSKAEMDFINSGNRMTALIRSFGELPYRVYDFPNGPYLGFDKSYDVFVDGSVVLVPAPGHTPGSIIAFIALPDGKRYALVGDLVWQEEGVLLPAEKPWISRDMVDDDPENVRKLIVQMHQLQQQIPGLVVVPAHDRRVWDRLPRFSN